MMSYGERNLRDYLTHSAGNCNEPTDHSVLCFIEMIQNCEIDRDIVRKVGGQWLIDRIRNQAKRDGHEITL
jgi:hypothetical protein